MDFDYIFFPLRTTLQHGNEILSFLYVEFIRPDLM